MEPRAHPTSAMVIFGNDEEVQVVDEQGGWSVWVRFGFAEGAPRITEMRLSPGDDGRIPAGGITTGVLRSLNTGPLYEALRNESPSRFTMALRGLDPDENFLSIRRPGRRGRDDTPYAVWAHRYVEKCRTSRRPYPELAEEHPGFSVRAIRDLILQARRRDLLTGASQGKTGGALTPKAEQLLAALKGSTT